MDRNIFRKIDEGSRSGFNWLGNQLNERGSYGDSIVDLACYYKSPCLYHAFGQEDQANLILDHIKGTLMRADGDFMTGADLKSGNAAFGEYWAYTNGWIALAAKRLGRLDISEPAYEYLKPYFHPKLGGFTTHGPYNQGDKIVDVLTTAHLGLVSLEFGDAGRAERAAHLLGQFVSGQPEEGPHFYLRMNSDGELVTEFPDEAAVFFSVRRDRPGQAYFMIGYPMAFLGLLFRRNGNAAHLDTARRYLEVAMGCHEGIFSNHFSHKAAWGAAILANITGEKSFAEFSLRIADYLLSIQGADGAWLKDQPAHTSYDQTAEIAIWLKEIAGELSVI